MSVLTINKRLHTLQEKEYSRTLEGRFSTLQMDGQTQKPLKFLRRFWTAKLNHRMTFYITFKYHDNGILRELYAYCYYNPIKMFFKVRLNSRGKLLSFEDWKGNEWKSEWGVEDIFDWEGRYAFIRTFLETYQTNKIPANGLLDVASSFHVSPISIIDVMFKEELF
jgi:hypothetical protein